MPWMDPSSPHFPCSALKATSGLNSCRISAMLRLTSTGVTLNCAASSARPQASPDLRLTSRSADQPPMGTATLVSLGTLIEALLRRYANPLDFPLELDARGLLHAPPHGFSKLLELRCRGASLVDQEIAMELRDLRRPDGKAPQSGLVDELPRLGAWRILESRAARAGLHRLCRFPPGRDLLHGCGDLRRIAPLALEHSRREDDILRCSTMAIGVLHVLVCF